jgi:hypothetical protein
VSEVQAALTSELLGLAGGSVATYILQQYSEKKKEYLASKRKQLQYVFAPLEVLLKMNKAEFSRFFDNNTTDDDRMFIETHIWYPNNSEIRKIIMEKSHLLPEIPDEFLRLLSHINVWLSEYKLVYDKKSKEPPVFAGPKGYRHPTEVDAYIYNEAKKLCDILNKRR